MGYVMVLVGVWVTVDDVNNLEFRLRSCIHDMISLLCNSYNRHS